MSKMWHPRRWSAAPKNGRKKWPNPLEATTKFQLLFLFCPHLAANYFYS
jgi:hypothetical protein